MFMWPCRQPPGQGSVLGMAVKDTPFKEGYARRAAGQAFAAVAHPSSSRVSLHPTQVLMYLHTL